MKYWHAASALLIGVVLFLIVLSVLTAPRLRRMEALLEEEIPDPAGIRDAWNDAALYLSFTALGDDLEEMEADLMKLENTEREDPAFGLTHARIKRRLKRLYEGFVPSLSGVF